MNDDDPTKPVANKQYWDLHKPYTPLTPIPPPPPRRQPWWHIAVPVAMLVALLLIIAILSFSRQPSSSATQAAPTITPTAVPTPQPTVAPTPASTQPTATLSKSSTAPTPYTAMELYQDFVNSGMSLGPPKIDNNWAAYEWYPLGGAVSWFDGPVSCGGCGGTSQTVEIAVFQSSRHIMDDQAQLTNDGFSDTYHNGCLLFWRTQDGTPPDIQLYQAVMDKDCY